MNPNHSRCLPDRTTVLGDSITIITLVLRLALSYEQSEMPSHETCRSTEISRYQRRFCNGVYCQYKNAAGTIYRAITHHAGGGDQQRQTTNLVGPIAQSVEFPRLLSVIRKGLDDEPISWWWVWWLVSSESYPIARDEDSCCRNFLVKTSVKVSASHSATGIPCISFASQLRRIVVLLMWGHERDVTPKNGGKCCCNCRVKTWYILWSFRVILRSRRDGGRVDS